MIYRSPYPDVTAPEIGYTHFILEKAHSLGDKPALIDGVTGRTLTFAQVVDGVVGSYANAHRDVWVGYSGLGFTF